MPPTPRFTLQGAWVRLDASLVEQWVNGEAEVELDLLDVGRVKVAVTQREVVDERFVILRGFGGGTRRGHPVGVSAGGIEIGPAQSSSMEPWSD